MHQIWDERYGQEGYAYGEKPNEYFRDKLQDLTPGKLLMPAEGEGRNAVYAAQNGWETDAFDQSENGKIKALNLASSKNTAINYFVGEFGALEFAENTYDAIGLIYAHFPAELKSAYHKKLATLLKPGGVIIFEAFSKNHLKYQALNPGVGGPKDVNMLFSIEEIQSDFENFESLELKEEEVQLNEGTYHIGLGSVVRCVTKKL